MRKREGPWLIWVTCEVLWGLECLTDGKFEKLMYGTIGTAYDYIRPIHAKKTKRTQV